MVAFAPILQADFSGTAFGAAPTWTDITRFARLKASPVTINAWRQDWLSDVAPSTAAIVLDNADLQGDATAPNAGRFTPDLSTSPFYPHVATGVRMRFGVTVNGTTYWLIDGYVDSWEASALDGDFSTCIVVISDILAQFGDSTPLRSMYTEEILRNDAPIAYWPLQEDLTAGGAASAVAGMPALSKFVGGHGAGVDPTFGATPLPDGMAAVTFNSPDSVASPPPSSNANRLTCLSSPVNPAPNGSWSLELWVNAGTQIPTQDGVLAGCHQRVAGQPYFLLDVFSAGGFTPGGVNFFYGFLSGGVFTSGRVWTPVSICDGNWHHVVAIADYATPQVTLYLDGVATSSATAALSSANAGTPFQVGAAAFLDGPFGPQDSGPFSGQIAHVAMYSGVLSAARIAVHRGLVLGSPGETSDARAAKLLSYRTNLGSVLDAGASVVGPQRTAGVTLAQALLDTGKAEGGLVYADGSARVTLLSRTRLRNPAVAATLDITGQQTTGDLRVRKDRQQIVNDMTVNRPGGTPQRTVDAASQTSDGVHAKSDTLILASDVDAASAAAFTVANGKTPRTRLPTLPVDLLTEPSLSVAAAVLSLAPLKRVTLANPPSWLPTLDVIVQGVTWTVGVDVFQAEFATSPLPRPTLRFDAAADAFTKLDAGNVFAW